MDPNSGRVVSSDQLEVLERVDPREAAKFTERLASLEEAVEHHDAPVLLEYTEQELSDLAALRVMRSEAKAGRRSGNPAERALSTAQGKAIEIEVRKIHRRAEKRARIAERMAK